VGSGGPKAQEFTEFQSTLNPTSHAYAFVLQKVNFHSSRKRN